MSPWVRAASKWRDMARVEEVEDTVALTTSDPRPRLSARIRLQLFEALDLGVEGPARHRPGASTLPRKRNHSRVADAMVRASTRARRARRPCAGGAPPRPLDGDLGRPAEHATDPPDVGLGSRSGSRGRFGMYSTSPPISSARAVHRHQLPGAHVEDLSADVGARGGEEGLDHVADEGEVRLWLPSPTTVRDGGGSSGRERRRTRPRRRRTCVTSARRH